EIALGDELRAGANQIERHEQRLHDSITDDDRDDEQRLDAEQQQAVLHQNENRRGRNDEMQRDEVNGDLAPEREPPLHRSPASIPYFSSLRYKAARLSPNASAAFEMFAS